MDTDLRIVEETIKENDIDEGPAGFTVLESQQIVDLFNQIDEDGQNMKVTPEQIKAIFECFNKGLITGLTTSIFEVILDKMRGFPDDIFQNIVSNINTNKIDEHTCELDKIECRKRQLNFHRCLFIVKRKLLQSDKLPGWILLDEYAVKTYNSRVMTILKIPEKVGRVLGKTIDNFSINRVYDIENDSFLLENDKKGEVRSFVKNVIKSLNNYNSLNSKKDKFTCFGDNSYYLFVIHRYPESKEFVMINQILIEKNGNGYFKVA